MQYFNLQKLFAVRVIINAKSKFKFKFMICHIRRNILTIPKMVFSLNRNKKYSSWNTFLGNWKNIPFHCQYNPWYFNFMVIVSYISGSNIFEFRSKILDCFFFFFFRYGNQSKFGNICAKYSTQKYYVKTLP